jgi:gluconate 5-dehydrogenase
MSTTLFDLRGRVALVTGGATGLGRMIAEGLLHSGARVALTSRKQDALDAAVAELSALGESAGVLCDITDAAQVELLFDEVASRLGPVDVLVCNAGATWGAPAEEMELRAWDKVIRTNLTGTFVCCQQFARRAIARGTGGKVVVVSSVNGLQGIDFFRTAGYAASKAGLIGLVRQLAVEWSQHGITINALAPGFFPSRMSRTTVEEHNDEIMAAVPLRRLGRPADLQGAAVFLAAPASDYITGQVLAVDGGLTAR